MCDNSVLVTTRLLEKETRCWDNPVLVTSSDASWKGNRLWGQSCPGDDMRHLPMKAMECGDNPLLGTISDTSWKGDGTLGQSVIMTTSDAFWKGGNRTFGQSCP